MIVTGVWQKIQAGIKAATPARDDGLRRVGLRLAAQTVVLLLAMLIALEVVVFVITQGSLLHSLETTLRSRAHPPQAFVHQVFHLRPRSGSNRRRPPEFSDSRRSDASVVYLDLHLHPVGHGVGYLGNTVLDPGAARQSLRSGRQQCCSEHSYGDAKYLVYTDVLRDRGKVVGVAQSSIAEDQYRSTLTALLQALLAVALLGLIILGVIGTLLARRALKPISLSIQQQRDFVSGAAHELRTPLAIMRTIGEVRLKDAATEDEQTALIQILAQNSHLTQLVDDLSLLARGDSQAVAIERVPVDLSSLVAVTTEDVEPLAAEQGVRLVTETQENVRILGDALRLRQLLIILLDNALKHTPAGGDIRVHLRVDGGQVRLQVMDSGSGIDPKHLPRIFDRFYRGDEARSGEGSGLGLAIAQWIVDVHGGQIHAENMPEGGARFTASLPMMRKDKRRPDPTRASSLPAR
jgi:signal transduction histidine kinase